MDFHTINITPDMNTEKIYAAYIFAKVRHKGQVRKFTGEDYFLSHPLGVAVEISNIINEEHMIKAALMHDLIEDTDTTHHEIKRLFGNKTAKLVDELSMDKSKKDEYGGKKFYLTFLINRMSSNAFTIKLVDRLDNIKYTADERTPDDFKHWYVGETTYILNHLEQKPNDIQLDLITELDKELSKY